MLSRLVRFSISQLIVIIRVPVFILALISPLLIVTGLLFLFPPVSSLSGSGSEIFTERYYSLTAITLISTIPFIYGWLISSVHLRETASVILTTDFPGFSVPVQRLKGRLAFSILLSFVMILPAVFLTDPVSTEGWLRSIYISSLLATTAGLVFIIATGFVADKKIVVAPLILSVLFLVSVPAGLLLHHPWNYFLFLSPFYWISWSWVTSVVSESILYGAISIVLLSGGILIFFRHSAKKVIR